jgi:hypothetical protein
LRRIAGLAGCFAPGGWADFLPVFSPVLQAMSNGMAGSNFICIKAVEIPLLNPTSGALLYRCLTGFRSKLARWFWWQFSVSFHREFTP